MTWRGMSSIVALVTILYLLSECHITRADTYKVGDEFGWDPTTSMEAWPQGKTFYAGDILRFVYDDGLYDLAVVNETGFDTCTVNDGAQVFNSGDNSIQLAFGGNYFICSTQPDLCPGGMKMAIDAKARPPSN